MLIPAISYQLSAERKSSLELNRDTLKTRTESSVHRLEKDGAYKPRPLVARSKEQYLLQSIAQGNHQAFWQLWLLYQDYLFHRCQMWMGGNDLDAEEALSQARLKAWEKLPNYASHITNPKAWLTRMTHNLCMDFHRQRQRCVKNIDNIEEIAVTTPELVASNSDSPESALLTHELKIYINYAINTLPPQLRETWILYYYYQVSYAEIAQRLMISKENVYQRIHKGRMILQKQLNKYFSEVNSPGEQETGRRKDIPKIPMPSSHITAFPESLPRRKNRDASENYYHDSRNKRDLTQRLSENNFDSATQIFSVEELNLPVFSIPVITEWPREIINYEVTALCLEKLSFAF